MFQGRLGRLTASLLLLEALVAIETLILTTALPAVEKDLGGIQFYGWVFSASSLATFAAIPIAGRATDRYGPRTPLLLMLVIYVAGLVVSGVAGNMQVLVVGRFVQGIGAGAFYSVSLGTVAKTYPERLRPRVLALLASMWALPGLFGPPLGALIATTIGWRWVFLAPIPALVVLGALILPAMRDVEVEPGAAERIPILWPLLLMFGAGLFLAGLTEPSAWSLGLIPIGLAVGLPALTRIAPKGSFRARQGLPAAAAAAFLLSAAFFAVDGFVPLMLTNVQHMSLGSASLIVTLATVAWSAGSWWQSRNIGRFGAPVLTAASAALIAGGTLAVATPLLDIPITVAYVGWTVAGVAMGVAFPTVPLAAMTVTPRGREAGELSAILLMDNLGVGLGAGLGGACIAIAKAGHAGLKSGIGGAFLVGLLAALLLIPVARGLPRGTPSAGPD